MMMRTSTRVVRAQLRNRLSSYEQARALRACYDIRNLLRDSEPANSNGVAQPTGSDAAGPALPQRPAAR